ncbi:MAG: sulfatase, partial [Myxococcota bacterium]
MLERQPFAELSIPQQSRPGGAEPPTAIPLSGRWRYEGSTRGGMYQYSQPIPIRPRGLFFFKPQPGMALTDGKGKALGYDRFGKHETPHWSIDREKLYVYMPARTPPPDGLAFAYPRAIDREKELNFVLQTRTAEREAFVWQSIQDDWDHRRGLLLPAPGTAAWSVKVPAAAEFTFLGGLVEPEVREGAPSDGATLVVEVDTDGQTKALGRFPLKIRDFTPQRVDLSRFAGKDVVVRVRTEPGATPDYDYAFLAEPRIASRLANPVRVLMVFIDTLRPDHMSLYGYGRDTTAAIDHLANTAVVFEQARSIAPWTLPSARTIVTGRQPEYYLAEGTQTLPQILGDAGYASAFIAGNVYLSVNFDMHRDWNLHRVGLWPSAQEVTDDALAWLDEHDGQNAVIQVHYMDPHLPYIEPLTYRPLYAGAGPAGLRTEFHLPDVRRARIENDPAAQQYIRDRYDNNIRYATDQIARLVDKLDDNDVLVLYSDHGEEFWEHGGFEHGHSLFDELLRVPLVIQGPGVSARRVDAPVSLLDVTPTILDLLEQPIPANVDGRSLVPVLRGETTAEPPLQARDQGFGRPLYGMERWGVLHDNHKWTTTEGREALYDLTADPGEQTNLLREPEGDQG